MRPDQYACAVGTGTVTDQRHNALTRHHSLESDLLPRLKSQGSSAYWHIRGRAVDGGVWREVPRASLLFRLLTLVLSDDR
jgi:hypothetical protein